jgi:undecaprenyl-diphosphatase
VESLEFDIALHLGTLLAILIYFFRDWLQIVAQAFGINYDYDPRLGQNRALLWLLAIGSIPVGVFGLIFNQQAETTWRNPYVMAVMLIAVGVLMWYGERTGTKKRDLASVDMKDAGAIGLSQALAIVPGTSRSGITMTTGLFRGLDREGAARFSFLLSTPAIAAAAGKALHDLIKHGGIGPDMWGPFMVGIAVSAVTGCVVIAWFLRYLRRGTLQFFVGYRIIFGLVVLVMALFVKNG